MEGKECSGSPLGVKVWRRLADTGRQGHADADGWLGHGRVTCMPEQHFFASRDSGALTPVYADFVLAQYNSTATLSESRNSFSANPMQITRSPSSSVPLPRIDSSSQTANNSAQKSPLFCMCSTEDRRGASFGCDMTK